MPALARWFEVSTGGYKRRVLAKDLDRAVIVFFLKEQPQHVGFLICMREEKPSAGHAKALYAYTPGILQKHFPGLACVEGRTKNSFRVIGGS